MVQHLRSRIRRRRFSPGNHHITVCLVVSSLVRSVGCVDVANKQERGRQIQFSPYMPACTNLNTIESFISVGVIGRPEQVNSDELSVLGTSLMEAYNQIATCFNGGSRLVWSAIFVPAPNSLVTLQSSPPRFTANDGFNTSFSLAFQLHGQCLSCQANATLFSDGARMLMRLAGANTEADGSPDVKMQYLSTDIRHMQRNADREPTKYREVLSCQCDGPTIFSFTSTYQNKVQFFINQGWIKSIDSIVSVEQLQPVDCEQLSVNTFDTVVLIDVVLTNDCLLDQFLQQLNLLGIGFAETYNTINSFGGLTCDPFFRTIPVDGVQVQANTAPDGLFLLPDYLPPAVQSNVRSFLYFVRGTCLGCNSTSNLFFNSGSGRRLSLQFQQSSDGFGCDEDVRFMEKDASRGLQYVSGIPSSSRQQCFCAAGVQNRAPTTQEFLQAYNATVQNLVSSGQVSFINSVQNVLQVSPAECSPNITSFTSTVIVSFSGNTSAVTQDDVSLLQAAFITAYNELSQNFCDPSFRSLDKTVFETNGTSTRRFLQTGRSATFVLTTKGTCRGCPSSTTLTNDVSGRRAQQIDRTERRRRIQTTNTCFCSINSLGNRAPTAAELHSAYNLTVSKLQLSTPLAVSGIQQLETVLTSAPTGLSSSTLPPTARSTIFPTALTTKSPTSSPTLSPSLLPTLLPSQTPTSSVKIATSFPTQTPTPRPTPTKTPKPSIKPTDFPTAQPTALPAAKAPTQKPLKPPTAPPKTQPPQNPTKRPTTKPSLPTTKSPTSRPSPKPKSVPKPPSGPSTTHPVLPVSPTNRPLQPPTHFPTRLPTSTPTSSSRSPTVPPTTQPTHLPSKAPTTRPVRTQTNSPTEKTTSTPVLSSNPPTAPPTTQPAHLPTRRPSPPPANPPTKHFESPPTSVSKVPSSTPPSTPRTKEPSQPPTYVPTKLSTATRISGSKPPTVRPTTQPTHLPTKDLTTRPSPKPTNSPTKQPVFKPTTGTKSPSLSSTTHPIPPSLPPITTSPTKRPTKLPTNLPTFMPTDKPVILYPVKKPTRKLTR